MREVLKRRLAQLGRVEDRLRRLVARSIEDIPDYPDDCPNSPTNIQELVLDAISQQKLGPDRRLPQRWLDQWHWCDRDNRTVARLKD